MVLNVIFFAVFYLVLLFVMFSFEFIKKSEPFQGIIITLIAFTWSFYYLKQFLYEVPIAEHYLSYFGFTIFFSCYFSFYSHKYYKKRTLTKEMSEFLYLKINDYETFNTEVEYHNVIYLYLVDKELRSYTYLDGKIELKTYKYEIKEDLFYSNLIDWTVFERKEYLPDVEKGVYSKNKIDTFDYEEHKLLSPQENSLFHLKRNVREMRGTDNEVTDEILKKMQNKMFLMFQKREAESQIAITDEALAKVFQREKMLSDQGVSLRNYNSEKITLIKKYFNNQIDQNLYLPFKPAKEYFKLK